MSGDNPYNPLKDEIFLPIPLKIAQRKDIKNLSKLVYGYLLKCFGHDGLVCPGMAAIAKDLKISRQHVSKSITELKNKSLIKIIKTGKASRYEFMPIADVTTVATSDVTTVATSDVTTVATSLIIKEKGKEKIKKSGAAPTIFNKKHPKIDQIFSEIPFKHLLSKNAVNDCMLKNGVAYIDYLLRVSDGTNDPAAYFNNGIYTYMAGYLSSEEHQVASAIAEFRSSLYSPIAENGRLQRQRGENSPEKGGKQPRKKRTSIA